MPGRIFVLALVLAGFLVWGMSCAAKSHQLAPPAQHSQLTEPDKPWKVLVSPDVWTVEYKSVAFLYHQPKGFPPALIEVTLIPFDGQAFSIDAQTQGQETLDRWGPRFLELLSGTVPNRRGHRSFTSRDARHVA